MVLWLVSIPYQKSKDQTLDKIKKSLRSINRKIECNEFHVPKLKYGTLDNCMNLSDELAKFDSQVEQQTNKILNILSDLSRDNKDFIPEVLKSANEAVPASIFLTNQFKWDENQYLVTSPLSSVLSKIVKKCEKYENGIRSQHHEYQNVKQMITSFEKKQEGNLLIKNLNGIVKKEDYIDTEYLTTMFVVVANDRKKEFLKEYAKIDDFVVPDSANEIAEDKEFTLFSVVVIKKIAQDFKQRCMKKKFVVRNFKYDNSQIELMGKEKSELTEQKDELFKKLTLATRIGFSECFVSWAHLKAIRVYIESILRYGLPPKFVTVLIKLRPKHIKNVHKVFRKSFSFLLQEEEKKKSKNVDVPMFGFQSGFEFHPYVLVTVNENPNIFRK